MLESEAAEKMCPFKQETLTGWNGVPHVNKALCRPNACIAWISVGNDPHGNATGYCGALPINAMD